MVKNLFFYSLITIVCVLAISCKKTAETPKPANIVGDYVGKYKTGGVDNNNNNITIVIADDNQTSFIALQGDINSGGFGGVWQGSISITGNTFIGKFYSSFFEEPEVIIEGTINGVGNNTILSGNIKSHNKSGTFEVKWTKIQDL